MKQKNSYKGRPPLTFWETSFQTFFFAYKEKYSSYYYVLFCNLPFKIFNTFGNSFMLMMTEIHRPFKLLYIVLYIFLYGCIIIYLFKSLLMDT